MPLTNDTKLADLIKAGAETLGDIPLQELLEYVQHDCLRIAGDTGFEGQRDAEFPTFFAHMAVHTQSALEALEASYNSIPKRNG